MTSTPGTMPGHYPRKSRPTSTNDRPARPTRHSHPPGISTMGALGVPVERSLLVMPLLTRASRCRSRRSVTSRELFRAN